MKGVKAQAIILALVFTVGFQSLSTMAKTGEQGSSNGQPFQTLQSRIDMLASDFETAIADLQSQIDEANLNLQQQINDLQASQAAQDQLIVTLQTAVNILKTRVASNESDIASLQALSNFQSQLIQALFNRLDALEARVASNESDIAAIILADQTMQTLITAIQGQIATLEARITANDGDIATLQSELSSLNASLISVQNQLALKQNRVNGVCGPGSSIRVIHADGSVECEADSVSSGVGSLTTTIVEAQQEMPGATIVVGDLSLNAQCPSTYTVTGGGFTTAPVAEGLQIPGDPRLVHVLQSAPVGSSTWNTVAINENFTILGSGRILLVTHAQCAKIQ